MFHSQQQIGPYTLIRLLGRGGFGEVWLAEKRGALMTTQVAVKLPLDPDPDLNAIREEAETWRRASGHPNVLPVIDADVYNGQVVIVSEYAAGGSLSGWLKQNGGKAPSIEAAVAMTTGILAGLEYLHALKPQPIIHRDLKPDNVLIQGGLPRLTDFGISRVLKTTGQTQNASGTPHYMPPEAFAGKYSPQSDVWAAGVMLYQMLSGNLPFPQADMPSLYGAILTGVPAPLPADVPEPLRNAIMNALEKNPARRLQSAAALRVLLNQPFSQPAPARPSPPQNNKPAPAGPSATPQFVPPRSSAPTIPQQQPDPAPQPAPTSRRNFLLGLGVTGAACGLYALNSYQQDKDKKEKESRKGGIKPDNTNTQTGGNQTGTGGAAKQNAGTESGTQPGTKTNPTDGAAMAWIPAGTFQMGGNGGEDEKPVHSVPLSGFWMYQTPVTVAQFRKYDAANGSKYDWTKNKPDWGWIDDHPMVRVSWDDASAYAQWAGVALPTEAQWEYAARGWLEGKNYPWGDDWDGSKCANSVKPNDLKGTKEVKSYPANGYGLYDMAGNVYQWCADRYDKDYYKTAAASQTDPKGPGSGTFRVLRGGSWLNYSVANFRCAYRGYFNPGIRDNNIGFRCCSPG